MENLRTLNMVEALQKEVVKGKKPFFGICLGMQLLALDSVELGFHEGLGWIDGHVVLMEPGKKLHVPHVGWNNVNFEKKSEFLSRIDDKAHFPTL